MNQNIENNILKLSGWIDLKNMSLYPIVMEHNTMKLKWNSQISGIYVWINKVNGKMYIGKSKNIYTRVTVEKWLFNRKDKKSSMIKLDNATKKYGTEQFEVRLLFIASSQLSELERAFINYYDTKRNGYNCTYGGEGVCGKKYTDEEKQNQSIIQKSLWTAERHAEQSKLMIQWFNGKSESEKEKMKTGHNWWLDPIFKQKHSQKLKEYHASHECPRRKKFQLLSPNGQIVNGNGVINFALSNNMCEEMVRRLLNKKISHYKGWKLI